MEAYTEKFPRKKLNTTRKRSKKSCSNNTLLKCFVFAVALNASVIIRLQKDMPNTLSSLITTSKDALIDNAGVTHPLKIHIAACITSNHAGDDFENMAVVKMLVPSLMKTIEHNNIGYQYHLFLGSDDDDWFWTNVTNQEKLKQMGKEQDGVSTRLPISFHFVPGQPNRIPFNAICKVAYDHGADYIIRINDDTQFVTANWTSLGIEQLKSYSPENVGMIGPYCREGNTKVLTHDMVHKTHMEIFNHKYYPGHYEKWFLEEWVTWVYGQNRTKRMSSWIVLHHNLWHGTRYTPNMVLERDLRTEIMKGKGIVQAWVDGTTYVPDVAGVSDSTYSEEDYIFTLNDMIENDKFTDLK